MIHRIGPGNYKVTRHKTLQAAFDNSVDGDKLQLHSNLVLKSAVIIPPSNAWTTEEGDPVSVMHNGSRKDYYQISRGSVAYESRESDIHGTRSMLTFNERYVTATRHWSFSDGNAWSVSWNSNVWTFTRSTNEGTITATKNDRHDATSISFTDNGATVIATCTWSFYGTDYDPSKTYTMTLENYYWRMKATDGSTIWSGIVYVPPYSETIEVVSKIGKAIEKTKHLTLDLYGYKLTNFGVNGAIKLRNASISLTVDSSRYGAAVVVTGNGNSIMFYANSLIDRVPSGSLTFKGNIIYQTLVQSSDIIRVRDTEGLTIESGQFESIGEAPQGYGNTIITLEGGVLTINGGKFLNETPESDVNMVYSVVNKNSRYTSTVIVNGGEFRNDSTVTGCYIFKNESGSVTLNGGRFIYPGSSRCVSICDYRGHTFWHLNFLRIVRGEFSTGALACRYDNGRDHNLVEYAEDGSIANVTQPNANGFYGIKVAEEGDYTWDGARRQTIPYRFRIPYVDEDLSSLCIRQSGDTLFIAHRNYPPAKIFFDNSGYAFFEELMLDNTDFYPPVIDSAVMVGNMPVETNHWPSEFKNPPAWLESGQKNYIGVFKQDCENIGTVTDAGFSQNIANGDDGSCSYACTYTCTSVEINPFSGKKTTTVSVISFTKSVTKETTTTYKDGLATGSTTKDITTTGTAKNSASATSVIVMRTVRYVATYVKDGKESRPSRPYAIDYAMPWANNAVVNISLSKGANQVDPEYYNIYKDNGNGYGLIATVGIDVVVGGLQGAVDTYPIFIPDNKSTNAAFVCAADYEEKRGWTVGDIFRKMVSSSRDAFSSSPSNDICLVNTEKNTDGGIHITLLNGGASFTNIRLMLDGRIYDKERDASYIIISTNRVKCTIYMGPKSGSVDGGYISGSVTVDAPYSYSFGGISGGIYYGIYEDWLRLQRRAFKTPNGDTVYGWLYGKGDCTEEFNSHLRCLNIDLTELLKLMNPPKGYVIKEVKLTFSESVYTYWTNNQQGCIHAIHFSNYSNGGMVQDDYINPDMSVTPPDDTQEPHFSSADDFPRCVGIYGQRLVFASTRTSPSTIWMSQIANLYNFTPHRSIREDDALELTLAATEFPDINHLVMGRDLMLFGDGGEWLISPISGNALTYKTASAKLQSMTGSDRMLQPMQLADETLFAERGGTSLRSINYNYTSDSYKSEDLSVIAQSLFRANPIVSMAYKQHPDSIVECVLADGRIATLVYMKEQDVAAWSVQELGGGWKAKEIVTPKCIINGTTEMMLLVEKSGVFQLWKVRDDDDTMAAENQLILDGMHIEGSDETISTDEIAVELGDGRYAVGYPIEAEFVSVRPEPEKGQTAQMEIKNATEVEIRVTDATTFSVKPYGASSGWREVSLPVVRNGASIALWSKDCKKLMTGLNSRDGRIHLKHIEPWPLTILSVSTTYQVEYENGGNEQ